MCDDRTAEFLSMARGMPGASNDMSYLSRRAAGSTTGTGGLGARSSLDSSSYLSGAGGGAGAGHGQLSSLSATEAPGGGGASTKQQQNKNNPAYQELRNFHKTAGDISRDIAATSAFLQELTQLVRHKSLFDDPAESARVNELVVRIKSNVENLNARLDDAGRTIAQQKRALGSKSQAGQEASNLVDGLKSEFAQTASGFKQVLQQRTDTMKETDAFQRQVYGVNPEDDDDDNPIPNMSALNAPPPVFSSSTASGGGGAASSMAFPTLDLTSGMMATGEATGSSLPRPHGITDPSTGMRHRGGSREFGHAYSGDFSQQQTPLTPYDIQRMEHEQGTGQQMQLIPDQEYLQERANAMSVVETNIVELGTIFNKLAVMVSEQSDMVQRVEDNVEDANTNVHLSLATLTDTLQSLKSGKFLALKLFSILVVFIIAFIVFFA